MPSDKPKFTLRVDKETLGKLKYIADNNFRTTNKELEMVIKNYIDDFEKLHGSIKQVAFLDMEEDKELMPKFNKKKNKKS